MSEQPSGREYCVVLASRLLEDYRFGTHEDVDELAEHIAEAARQWLSQHGYNHGQLGVRRDDGTIRHHTPEEFEEMKESVRTAFDEGRKRLAEDLRKASEEK